MHLNWKPSKIFYGWWVVGACFLIWLFIGGFVTFGFTAFFEPIANEFSWSYTQISFAASLRGMETGILSPLLGLVVDRWGPRRLMFGGIVVIGIGLTLLSYTTSLGMFYGAFALVAIGISSSASPTVTTTAVANWFRRKSGIAIGVMTCGFALGGLMVPVIVRLIDILGWKSAIFVLGLIIVLIGLPLSLLVRHKPEQYGYLPDGDQINTLNLHKDLPPAHAVEVNIGARRALKSRTFWHIGPAWAFLYIAVSAVTSHVMPYLSSVGIARSTSSLVAMGVPLTSIIGRLGSGWLGDRFNKKLIASICLAITSLGLLAFSYTSNEGIWLLIPFIILYGIGWGGSVPIRAALVREHFGRSNFGTIFGFLMTMTALGSIIGPLFAGWVFDNWGSYNAVWLVIACLIFTAVIMIATIPPVSTNVQVSENV